MTYQEFLTALAQTPREWYLDKTQRIRRPPAAKYRGWRDCECPIEAVFGTLVASATSLRSKKAIAVVYAADHESGYSAAIRADLLRACGLTESA